VRHVCRDGRIILINGVRKWVWLICLLLIFAGCATQPSSGGSDAPGFLVGLLHGVIAPFAALIGLFSDSRIYAFPNSGISYDIGFLIGLAFWGGGAASSRRTSKQTETTCPSCGEEISLDAE
jgi:hypothetical protein